MRRLLTVPCLALAALGHSGRNPEAPVAAEISDYVVILDAGSTGTRAQAFYYPKRVLWSGKHDVVSSKPITLPKPLFFTTKRPGISFYLDDDAGLYRYLRDFTLEVAKTLRKHDQHTRLSKVPIYLGATAGMRNLDERERKKLFAPVRRALRDSPFFFGRAAHARVLSGEEEAAYGWLTVNYFHGCVCADAAATFGSLDMGGESTEVAFIPEEPSIMAGMFPMHFGQLPGAIHLYTHSYMHFGLLSAFQRVTGALFRSGSKDRLEHPCLPRGLRWQVQEGVFGVSTNGHAERSRGSIALAGTSDFGKCEKAMDVMFDEAPCTQTPCSFLGVFQPSIKDARFYMRGELGKIFNLLVPERYDEPLLLALRGEAQRFCGRSLEEQEHATEHRAHRPAVPELTCFLACYAFAFLVKGLHFEATTKSLMMESAAHDWPQGAAIYHVNFYPYRVHSYKHGENRKSPDGAARTRGHPAAEMLEQPMVQPMEGGAGGDRGAGDGSDDPGLELPNASVQVEPAEVLAGHGGDHEPRLRRKELHRYLDLLKKQVQHDRAEEVELWVKLKQVIARVRKRQKRVAALDELLGEAEPSSHPSNHSREDVGTLADEALRKEGQLQAAEHALEASGQSPGEGHAAGHAAGQAGKRHAAGKDEQPKPSGDKDGHPGGGHEGKQRSGEFAPKSSDEGHSGGHAGEPRDEEHGRDPRHDGDSEGHKGKKHAEEGRGDPGGSPPSPVNRAFLVDAGALACAALASVACLVGMSGASAVCCKGRLLWRRPAQEPLLAA